MKFRRVNIKSTSVKKAKYTEIEKMAYNLGQISRGLKNSNSRVYESYQNGITGKTKTNKKPLF